MTKWKVWKEEDPRSEAVEIEASSSKHAAEYFGAVKMVLVPDDAEQGLLVEWPTGQIERIMVWAFAVVMVKSDLEHTRFDELEVRIWAKDEDFFWQLVLECTQVMGLENLQAECSDPRCPVHGTHPTLPHGPFESWDLAYQNARESCSIPDDGREDPNC